MSLKNLSTTPGNNTLAPPYGAPESSTKLKDFNDIWRYLASVVRHFAASNTIASAATTDLGSLDETWLTVSGAATITSFGTVSADIFKFVTYSGAATITHNATSLILLTGANRTAAAGDCQLLRSLGGGNWKEYFYSPYGTPASYQPLDAQLTTLAGITAQQATDLASVSTFMGTVLNDTSGDAMYTTMGADKSHATNGYQKLPSGLIIQWGQATSSSTTSPNVPGIGFPIAFPTALLSVVGIPNGFNGVVSYVSNTLTTFSLDLYIANTGALVSGNALYWIAVGY